MLKRRKTDLEKYRERARKTLGSKPETVTVDYNVYENIKFDAELMDDIINELVKSVVEDGKPNLLLLGQLQYTSKQLRHMVKRES